LICSCILTLCSNLGMVNYCCTSEKTIFCGTLLRCAARVAGLKHFPANLSEFSGPEWPYRFWTLRSLFPVHFLQLQPLTVWQLWLAKQPFAWACHWAVPHHQSFLEIRCFFHKAVSQPPLRGHQPCGLHPNQFCPFSSMSSSKQ